MATTRKLRTPMLIDPGEFLRATRDLTTREVGAATLLAVEFWRDGVLPSDAQTRRILGIKTAAAVELRDRLAPLYEPSGVFGLMRAVACTRSARRARGAAAANAKRWGRDAAGA